MISFPFLLSFQNLSFAGNLHHSKGSTGIRGHSGQRSHFKGHSSHKLHSSNSRGHSGFSRHTAHRNNRHSGNKGHHMYHSGNKGHIRVPKRHDGLHGKHLSNHLNHPDYKFDKYGHTGGHHKPHNYYGYSPRYPYYKYPAYPSYYYQGYPYYYDYDYDGYEYSTLNQRVEQPNNYELNSPSYFVDGGQSYDEPSYGNPAIQLEEYDDPYMYENYSYEDESSTIYEWTDDEGIKNYTNSLDYVPYEYEDDITKY